MKFLKNYCLLAALLLTSFAQASSELQAVSLERISKAQAQLAAVQADIEKEATAYYQRLNRVESDIKTLREKAAGAQRLADEKLLSLEKLDERVEKWQAQSSYQTHLVSSYFEGSDLLKQKPSKGEEINVQLLNQSFAELKQLLSPQWKDESIVLDSGDIKPVSIIHVGPVSVVSDDAQAGLVEYDLAKNARVAYGFSKNQSQSIAQLKQAGQGGLTFDPTLGNAQDLIEHEGSVYSHVEKGGVWVIPILVFALLSLSASVAKAIQLFRLPSIDASVAEKVVQLKATNPSAEEFKSKVKRLASTLGSAQTKLLSIWVRWPSSEQRDDLFVAHLMEYRHSIERYMGIIATSAAIAPLLGLLGTVSGMINTFKMMTIFGAGDAATVSGGISEALVTTELGLVVAIPSLIMSALLSRKIKSYCHNLEASAVRLSKV